MLQMQQQQQQQQLDLGPRERWAGACRRRNRALDMHSRCLTAIKRESEAFYVDLARIDRAATALLHWSAIAKQADAEALASVVRV